MVKKKNCKNNTKLILDLGEPPYEGKKNPAFEILFSLGATKGSRAGIDERVLPSADNMLVLMDRLEEEWSRNDFSIDCMVLWIMPEGGMYINHCKKLGIAPEKYFMEILRRSRELNEKYGPWRITLHARAEFDSCFIDFPAKWNSREESYSNWEKYNLTDLFCKRYIKYGHPLCRAGMTENYPIRNLFEYFTTHGMKLKDFPMDVCCNRAWDIHHNFKWGWPCVSIENFCGSSWNSHLLMAYARGGAKEYNARWGCDFSAWGGVAGNYETMYHRDGRWFGGVSANLSLRGWMMGFLNGADYIEVEVADKTHFVLDHEPEPPVDDFGGTINERTTTSKKDLSPVGINGVKFGQYVLKRYPERGTPYTPMAIIVHSKNGWNVVGAHKTPDVTSPPKDPHIDPYQVWFGRLKSTPAEWMIGAFYRKAFESEPIFAWQNDCWRKFGPPADENIHNSAAQEARYKLLVKGKVNVEEAEEGRYMGKTRWGDAFDVFDEDVSIEILKHYPVMILLGIMPDSDVFWHRIEEYVRNGGTVIVNVAQIPQQYQEFFGAEWEIREKDNGIVTKIGELKIKDAKTRSIRGWQTKPSIYNVILGKGTVYLTTKVWAVNSAWDIDPEMIGLVNYLYETICPVKVIGEATHWIMNKLDKGWLVSIFNHYGYTWRGEISVKDCMGRLEQWKNKELKGTKAGESVLVEVPPYSFRIFYFEKCKSTLQR